VTAAPTPERFNSAGVGKLPGHLGIVIIAVSTAEVIGELPVVRTLMAPNGYLHAGSVVTLADTCAGYGCVVNFPAGATGFTTIELKSNHVGTAREGTLIGVARPAHLGKTIQVWDTIVRHKESGKAVAMFRCTQMILYTPQRSKSELP
jgi:1,4-dihydroxy-2-naphthoyl-CoA hydrolase